VGDYTLAHALKDIATMLDLVMDTSGISALLKDAPQLADMLRKIPTWMTALTDLQNLDMGG
jgi:hypothetical protein